MLLPQHGFTILLTENSISTLEISVSTLVFTKVLTVFAVKKLLWCTLCSSYTELTLSNISELLSPRKTPDHTATWHNVNVRAPANTVFTGGTEPLPHPYKVV